MAWTVPSGCYYWYHQFATSTLPDKNVYYSAGQTVPTEYSPNRSYPDNFSLFALVDFTNGVIYAVHAITININNSNNTFTVTKYPNSYVPKVHIICSNQFDDYYPYSDKPVIVGDAFSYGDGSGIRAKFVHSTVSYDASYAFAGRTDIVTAPTLPNSVDAMVGCFAGCTSLTTMPSAFPTGVTSLSRCFAGCTSLTTVTTIPNYIDNMSECFDGCTALESAPIIPSSVTRLTKTFKGCSSLAGTVTINSNASYYTDTFNGTVNDIVLLGSGSSNTSIASQYANVYAWSLSASITAQRDESVLTSVDISVDVTRFNTGALTSLSLYENGGQTPLSVTWNDPTLTITDNPTTFTTTIANIAESDTPTISVIATDAYGSTTEVSVNVPIAFYTMDVQAGGKEIAFGAIANDNLTSHPDGLFRCNMDALLVGNTTEVENPYYSLDTTASPGTTDGDLYAAITALSWQSDDPLDVKKLLTEILTDIADLKTEVNKKKYKGYGAAVDIASYSSSSNTYTVPNDGIVRIICTYRSNSYIQLYNSSGTALAQQSSTGNANMCGNLAVAVPVYKGMKIYVVRSSTYSSAIFIPYTY